MNQLNLEDLREERDLFREFRNALILNNREQAKEIAMEYGRRGYETMNGELLTEVFKRNSALQEWVEKGKATI